MFWVQWEAGLIEVGSGDQYSTPFMSWQDPTQDLIVAGMVETAAGVLGAWQFYQEDCMYLCTLEIIAFAP